MGYGKYFKSNALKTCIMHSLFFASEPLTTREIAERIGVPPVNVSKQMCMYRRKRCGYFRRLKPIEGKAFRYKITEKGEKYFFIYCSRVYNGYDLNLRARVPQHMPKYDILKQQRLAAFDKRQEEFEKTGVQQPEPPKPTLEDWINLKPEDLEQYIGLTKRGALEMGLAEADLVISLDSI